MILSSISSVIIIINNNMNINIHLQLVKQAFVLLAWVDIVSLTSVSKAVWLN